MFADVARKYIERLMMNEEKLLGLDLQFFLCFLVDLFAGFLRGGEFRCVM